MSAINFLFGNREPGGFRLDGMATFEADLTIDETHERSAQATEHPIESGAVVSDHVILSPQRLRLSGFVSDAGVAVFGSQPGRTQGAFDALDAAWASREPLDVVTGYKTYRSMVITNLTLPRERPESMRFSMELQHVTIVSSETGELSEVQSGGGSKGAASNNEASESTGGQNNAGRQPTQPAGGATESAAGDATSQSTLAGIFG